MGDCNGCGACEDCTLAQGCNPHPDAPHGFDRNGSHNEGRYVCDCEHWQPINIAVDPAVNLSFYQPHKRDVMVNGESVVDLINAVRDTLATDGPTVALGGVLDLLEKIVKAMA